MPVETPHPDYSNSVARWRKNRDAYKGEDAVKARDAVSTAPVVRPSTTAAYGSERYLTRPGGFEDV